MTIKQLFTAIPTDTRTTILFSDGEVLTLDNLLFIKEYHPAKLYRKKVVEIKPTDYKALTIKVK